METLVGDHDVDEDKIYRSRHKEIRAPMHHDC